jgi:hypothetical protein
MACPPGKAGLFDAVVEPGDSIDLQVAVPAVRRPGHFRLFVDMEDGDRWTFSELGQEPLERELEVR